jgi:hypothetical protein
VIDRPIIVETGVDFAGFPFAALVFVFVVCA